MTLRLVTPRMRCVDWNIHIRIISFPVRPSHLVWGVWIEIIRLIMSPCMKWVTPRMRCVDWNNPTLIRFPIFPVTPRMRCVDWNDEDVFYICKEEMSHLVWGVWIEMTRHICSTTGWETSHLVWGVWIEILPTPEGKLGEIGSHLVWGVWIEIKMWLNDLHTDDVTPRMRCVDWNVFIYPITIATGGHTSYEVCGLKFLYSCLRNAKHHRHTSYEVCGLKSLLRTAGLSNPPRHTSYEVCGLKYTRRKRGDRVGSSGHTSYEVCGLKYLGWRCLSWRN